MQSISDFAKRRARVLAAKICAGGFLIVTAGTIIFTMTAYTERLNYAAKSIEANLVMSLLLGDTFQLTKMMGSLSHNSDVISASVVDQRTGSVVASQGQIDGIDRDSQAEGLSIRGSWFHPQVIYSHPLMNKEEVIGHLFLTSRPPLARGLGFLFVIFLVLVALSALLVRSANSLAIEVAQPMTELASLVKLASGRADVMNSRKRSFRFQEINDVESEFRRLLDRMDQAEENERKAMQSVIVEKVAAKVRHDVRQALVAASAALKKMLGRSEDLSLMRAALERIESTINEIPKFRVDPSSAGSAPNNHLPASIQVMNLLAPMVYEFESLALSEHPGVEVRFEYLELDFDAFVEVEPSRFRRMLANIFANSLQAISDKGLVTLKFKRVSGGTVVISIEDNGSGIPGEVLNQVGTPGFSFGKSGGIGLGLSTAREYVSSWHGELKISSVEGAATKVEIHLPESTPDDIYLSGLPLTDRTHFISLDDDPTVHRIWRRRFRDRSSIEARECYDIKSANQAIADARARGQSFLLLVDYDLGQGSETGLDYVERLGLQSNAILVSNNAEDQNIIKRCRSLGVPIVPKSIQASIPFVG